MRAAFSFGNFTSVEIRIKFTPNKSLGILINRDIDVHIPELASAEKLRIIIFGFCCHAFVSVARKEYELKKDNWSLPKKRVIFIKPLICTNDI